MKPMDEENYGSECRCVIEPILSIPLCSEVFNLNTQRWEFRSDDMTNDRNIIGLVDTETLLAVFEQMSNEGKKEEVVRKESVMVSVPLSLITLKNRPVNGVISQHHQINELEGDLEKDLSLSDCDDNNLVFEELEGSDLDINKNYVLSLNNQLLCNNNNNNLKFIDESPKELNPEYFMKNSNTSLRMYLKEFSSPKNDANLIDFHHYTVDKVQTNNDLDLVRVVGSDSESSLSIGNSDSTVEVKLPSTERERDLKIQSTDDYEFQEEILPETSSENENTEIDSNPEWNTYEGCEPEEILLSSQESEDEVQNNEAPVSDKVPEVSVKRKLTEDIDYLFIRDELDYEDDLTESFEPDNNGASNNLEVENENATSELIPVDSNRSFSPAKKKIKWDKDEVLKKLNSMPSLQVDKKATSSKTAEVTEEIQIHTDILDDLDEEMNDSTVEISVTSRCSPNASEAPKSTTPIEYENMDLLSEIKSMCEEGLVIKAMQCLKKFPILNGHSNVVGIALTHIVDTAGAKNELAVITQCFEFYHSICDRYCFYLRTHRNLVTSLILACKNHLEVFGKKLESLYIRASKVKPSRLFLTRETANILLKALVNGENPDWRLVLNLLHFIIGVARIVPDSEPVNTLLRNTSKIPNKLASVVKLLKKDSGKILFPTLNLECLEKFYLLMEDYKTVDREIIGSMIKQYFPSNNKTLIEGTPTVPDLVLDKQIHLISPPCAAPFTDSINQYVRNCIVQEKYQELAGIFINVGVEKGDRNLIHLIYEEILLCNERAGFVFKMFVNSIQWRPNEALQLTPKIVYTTQYGVALLVDLYLLKLFNAAMEVVETLFTFFTISFFDIQKYFESTQSGLDLRNRLVGLKKTDLVLIATDVCVQCGKIMEAFQILNECQWAPIENEDSSHSEKLILTKLEVFNALLHLLFETASKLSSDNHILKAILANGVKLIENSYHLFTNTDLIAVEKFQTNFNKFFCFVLNAGLLNETESLIDFHHSVAKFSFELDPSVSRGIAILMYKTGHEDYLKYFIELMLQDVYHLFKVSDQVLKLQSFLTLEEIVTLVKVYLEKRFVNTVNANEDFSKKYSLTLEIELCILYSEQLCGIEALKGSSSSTLDSCQLRVIEACTNMLKPPLIISFEDICRTPDKLCVPVRPYTVFKYVTDNFLIEDFPAQCEKTSRENNDLVELKGSKFPTLSNPNIMCTPRKTLVTTNIGTSSYLSPKSPIERPPCNLTQSIRNSPKHSRKRNSPKYALKRISPKDLAKRDPPKDLVKRNSPKDLVKGNSPKYSVKGNSPKYSMKRNSPKDLVKRNSPKDLVKRNSPKDSLKGNSPKDSLKTAVKNGCTIKPLSLTKRSGDDSSSKVPRKIIKLCPKMSANSKTGLIKQSIVSTVDKVSVPPDVKKKIEQFIIIKLKKEKHDVTGSGRLMEKFIKETCCKLNIKITKLNPVIMKELISFTKENIRSS